jgi:hypothetical protein
MASNALTIKELLNGAEQLGTKELNVLSRKVHELLSRRKVPALPREEANLLIKINEAVSIDLLSKADFLHQKRRAGTLANHEQEELVRISDEIERQHVERMGYLLKLAQLRNVTLPELMKQLDITPYQNAF